MPMARTLEELREARLANMDQLVHLLAQQAGYDLAEGLPPALRVQLEGEAEHAYEQWGELAEASHAQGDAGTEIHRLLRLRHEIDKAIFAMQSADPREDPPV
jgi:hypothetical protein